MSTKITIAHGPDFHLYHEGFDRSNVYLEVEETQFEASYNRVMVPIPVHIWEVIRQYAGVDLRHAEKTDEELKQYVEQEVDSRLKKVAESSDTSRAFLTVVGSLAFGTADQPREEQIERGLTYFIQMREQQRRIKQAIQELEQLNRRIRD